MVAATPRGVLPSVPYPLPSLNTRNKELRLLEILPDDEDDMVRCRMRTYSLGDHPSYTALSYEWGPRSPTKTIRVNDQAFDVRINLWHWLVEWRKQHWYRYKRLYIDAICVNQGNVAERNHQVRLFKDIYSSADHVAAWLGPAENNSDLGMDKLEKWGALPRFKLFAILERARRAAKTDEERAISNLMSRSYWERMWIIQEVCVAKSLVLHCGSKRTEPPRGFPLGSSHSDSSEKPRRREIARFMNANGANILDQRRRYQFRDESERGLCLVDALELSAYAKSEDVRDRIYAVLGLLDPKTSAFLDLVPDYNMSIKRLVAHMWKKTEQVEDKKERHDLRWLLRAIFADHEAWMNTVSGYRWIKKNVSLSRKWNHISKKSATGCDSNT